MYDTVQFLHHILGKYIFKSTVVQYSTYILFPIWVPLKSDSELNKSNLEIGFRQEGDHEKPSIIMIMKSLALYIMLNKSYFLEMGQ